MGLATQTWGLKMIPPNTVRATLGGESAEVLAGTSVGFSTPLTPDQALAQSASDYKRQTLINGRPS